MGDLEGLAQFNPDGRVIATINKDGAVELLDATTLDRRGRILNETTRFSTLVFGNADESVMATLDANGVVQVWNGETAQPLYSLEHSARIDSMAFSPDGRTLATRDEDNALQLWSIAAGQLLHSTGKQPAGANSIAFSSDGTHLATAGEVSVNLWSTSDYQVRRILKAQASPFTEAIFTRDGQRVVASNAAGRLFVWDVKTGQLLHTIEGTGDVLRLALGEDEDTVAAIYKSGQVQVWDVERAKRLRLLDVHLDGIASAALSSDGDILAVASSTLDPTTAFFVGQLQIWDVHTNTLMRARSIEPARSLAFSPDENLLAIGNEDAIIRLWDVGSGQLVRQLEGHRWEIDEGYPWGVNSLAFSPDGQTLASEGDDNTVRVWDIATGQLLRTLERVGAITLKFSPDGRFLVLGDRRGIVQVWGLPER